MVLNKEYIIEERYENYQDRVKKFALNFISIFN